MQKTPISTHRKAQTRVAHAVLLGTTALVLSTGLALAQDLPTSSNISQIGATGSDTNTLMATTTGQNLFVNSAVNDGAVQDAAGGSNSLVIDVSNTAGSDPTANYVFVTQLGNTISTITLDGAANMIYLRSFGGAVAQTTQTIDVTGDGNTVDAATNAQSGAEDYGLFDINITGDDIVVNVTNDEFADIYVAAIGSGDTITVVQDNDGAAASATEYSQINVQIESSAGYGAGTNNTVLIRQLGINNILDFDLVGDENDVSVTQSNDTAGVNNLTVDVTDARSTVAIAASGEGTNVFRVGGSGSELTVNSDTGANNGVSTANATSALDIFGTDNVVRADDFTDVSIRIGTEASIGDNGYNIVLTSGNAEVSVYGTDNAVRFMNTYDDTSSNPTITFGGLGAEVSENNFTLSNRSTLNMENGGYQFTVLGNSNTSGPIAAAFETIDVYDVDVTIDGDGNALYGTITQFREVALDVIGYNNRLQLNVQGSDTDILDLDIEGDGNSITAIGGGGAFYDLDYTGDYNSFDYEFGTSNLSHVVYGSGFAGAVTEQGTGYTSSFRSLGTGFVQAASNGSSLIVASGCTYGTTCDGSF